ncbi:MAG: hypothetical protein R6U54_03515 [Candidatus Omnitrophota bacterium]
MTLKSGRGRHRKYLPYAFTEQGVAMLEIKQSNNFPPFDKWWRKSKDIKKI